MRGDGGTALCDAGVEKRWEGGRVEGPKRHPAMFAALRLV